jgi:hypothetical protein
MTTYTNNCIEGKINVDAVGLTAGESDSLSPYQSPDSSSGVRKEWPKVMSAAEYEDLKNFFEYIIIKQNKAYREELKDFRQQMKHYIKALQDNMEINNAKILDILHSRTRKLTHLIIQVQKETEVEMTTDNQMIEKNVELNPGITEAQVEGQVLSTEVLNVDSVRS